MKPITDRNDKAIRIQTVNSEGDLIDEFVYGVLETAEYVIYMSEERLKEIVSEL